MAVCKRCGKSFDYQKREGVCPKCCFYNRPEGTWKEDDSWIKNYNYEDNSYNVTVSSYEDDYGTKEEKRNRYFMEKERKSAYRHSGKEVDGSHSHLSDGRVVRGSDPTGRKTSVSKNKQKSGSAKKSKISWVFTILFLYWLFYIIRAIFGIF